MQVLSVMNKKPSIPSNVRSERQCVDNDFHYQGREQGFAEILDDCSFTYLWASFSNWVESSRSSSLHFGAEPKANNGLPPDEVRLRKLEAEAIRRGIPPSERNAVSSNQQPPFKYVAPPLILRTRALADGDLSTTLCNEALCIMRKRMSLWLQGPRSFALQAELPKDRATLAKIEKEGRARRLRPFRQLKH